MLIDSQNYKGLTIGKTSALRNAFWAVYYKDELVSAAAFYSVKACKTAIDTFYKISNNAYEIYNSGT